MARSPELAGARCAPSLALIGLALVAILVAREARSHPLDHPKRDELRLSASRIELVIDEEIAPGPPAQALRAIFDRDRNGQLDASEQAALLEHLARTAELHVSLSIDDAKVQLTRVAGSVRGDHLGADARSTALLTVRLTLSAAWPAGSGDWRGRRHLVFIDDAPDATGHVPTQVYCSACAIADANTGTFAHDPRGDWLLGGETSPAIPLALKLRLSP